MNVIAFREAREKFNKEISFFELKRYKMILDIMDIIEEAAAPEHVKKYSGDGHIDRVECSCGWKSIIYLDALDLAQEAWREHVADEMGLAPKKCPCGREYLPFNGERPCHEFQLIGSE